MRPFAQGGSGLGRALRSRNYRLFFLGQGLSLIGTWMSRVAAGWLVYRLTGSPLLLGLVGFAGQIPTFLLTPVAGVLLDRWDRHRVLLWTQVAALAHAALLAAFTLSGVVTVHHVLVLAVFQGLINAFDLPARQTLVVDLVERREDLPNAIALNSSLFNSARLIGPSIAGLMIAAVGEGWCFALDAASYVAVIAALSAMRLPPRPPRRAPSRIRAELAEGLRYVARTPRIRDVLVLLTVISFAGTPYLVLMPAIATEVFGGGPTTLGALMGAVGLGALTGALYLAARPSTEGLDRFLVAAAGVFAAGLLAFSLTPSFWAALVILAITGFGMIAHVAACNTLLQTEVEEDKRGRVMSFYGMTFFGSLPLASLLGGALAERIGVQATVFAGGVIALVAVLGFARGLPLYDRVMRALAVRLGVLPELPAPAPSSAKED